MCILTDVFLFILAKMGSQVLVPFRGSEDNPRHLKLMGDLGQVAYQMKLLLFSFIEIHIHIHIHIHIQLHIVFWLWF